MYFIRHRSLMLIVLEPGKSKVRSQKDEVSGEGSSFRDGGSCMSLRGGRQKGGGALTLCSLSFGL